MGSGKRQYMSAIFAHNEEQLAAARESHAQKVSEKKGRVSTVVEKATDFYEAEAYHQKWLLQRKANWFRALELQDARDMIESPAACRLNAYVAQAIDTQTMVGHVQKWGEGEGVSDEVRQNVLRRIKLED
uniref:peptide-methionine (S)-S-oxide reductase n=1 Tax=Hemiselmis andersenii TaxID=464988 RepID=A0A6U4KGY4_HEMAN|mmetsp:Transcript_32960/g.77021  ORF Transcript_32960/g.77021 Transcript_32960/m.77021 type:complete len:130 (-) Transcript_32960:314-703(-)